MKEICLICGAEFEKNSINQKYCSVLCYKKNKKESQKKYQQSDKFKETRKKYQQSDKFKESLKKYRQSDKCKESQKKHQQSDKFKETRKKYEKKIMTTLSDYYIKRKLGMSDAPKLLS